MGFRLEVVSEKFVIITMERVCSYPAELYVVERIFDTNVSALWAASRQQLSNHPRGFYAG